MTDSFTRFNRPIVVVDYDDQWPLEFERERMRLSSTLGTLAADFEHIGSTAVPGLAGKPVIDVGIGIPKLDAAPDYIEVLVGAGYKYVPEFEVGLPRRRFLWQGTQQVHTHHLHVTEIGDRAWLEPLASRDYLRSHPSAAAEYGELKRQLAEKAGENIEDYISGKSGFISEILRRVGLV